MPLKAPRGFIDVTDPKVCKVGHPAPAWVVCYADLMTELVCFFVILYALSAALNPVVQGAKDHVEEMIEAGEIKGEVTLDKDGLYLSLMEKESTPSFTSGSSELTQPMKAQLDKLAPVFKDVTKNNEILVEGHTDDVPISDDYYDSNWELSVYRAVTVARYFVDKHAFPPDKIGAVGYGEFRPVVPNDSDENRAKNRRVVFWVKNSKKGEDVGKEKEKKGEAKAEDAAKQAPTGEVSR